MEIQLISTMVLIHLNNKNNDLFYVKNQQSAPAKTYGVSPAVIYNISKSTMSTAHKPLSGAGTPSRRIGQVQ